MLLRSVRPRNGALEILIVALVVLSSANLASAWSVSHLNRAGTLGTPREISPEFGPQPVLPVNGWWQFPAAGSSIQNRTGFQMTFDPRDGYTLLFGGCIGQGTTVYLDGCSSPSNQTWRFENGIWIRIQTAVAPPGRYFGMMTYDPAMTEVLLFGGNNGSATINDTWAFADGSWTQLHPTQSPPGMEEAGMAYDALAGATLVFGGLTSGALSASDATWQFADGNWTNQTTSVHPPGWVTPAMAGDPQGGVVVHGGISALFFPTYYQETWVYGSGGWTNVTAAAGASPPPAVLYSLAVFDSVRDQTLVFGGATSTSVSMATWEYSSTGIWQQIVPSSAAPGGAFYEDGASFDSVAGLTIEFGHEGLGSFYGIPTIQNVVNSTWVLLPTLKTAGVEGNTSAKVGSNQTFSVVATGGLPPYSYRWTFGTGATSNLSSPVYDFPNPGVFSVNVTITDPVGQAANSTLRVTVTSSGGPSSSALQILGEPAWIVGLLVAIVAVVIGVVILLRRRRGVVVAAPSTESGVIDEPPVSETQTEVAPEHAQEGRR